MYCVTNYKNLSTMKKRVLAGLVILAGSSSLTLQAQTTDALKKEVTSLHGKVAALTTQNSSLTKENAYYKEALRINTPIMKGIAQGVTCTLTQVLGDKTNKTITISFLAESPVAVKHSQIEEGTAIDAEGNTLNAVNYGYGPRFLMTELFEQVPVKGVVIFKKVDKEIPVLKIFKLSHYPRDTERDNRAVIFKDVPVKWQ
jgi:hypothetical protein